MRALGVFTTTLSLNAMVAFDKKKLILSKE